MNPTFENFVMARSLPYVLVAALLLTLASARAVHATSNYLRTTERLTTAQYTKLRRRWCVAGGRLVCNFIPTTNSSVAGTVMFESVWVDEEIACRTSVKAKITGLSKNAMQAMHIHDFGDLTSPDGKSCGGHFSSPAMRKTRHGMPDDTVRHWGDLGSLKSDKNGNAMYYRVDKLISLNGIVGRGMIIHRDMDKGVEAQPSGGAGPRKAMCVIGFSNPTTLLDA